MKLEIKQNILIEHLNYVIKGISNKNIIPVLNCIKFELEEEGLFLTSTDNEIAIKTFIPNKDIEKIEKCGIVVVSGRFIYDIVKKLPNTIIQIEEVLDNKLFITTTTSSFNLNCNEPTEFPNIDLSDTKTPVFINKKIFKNIIRETSFAASLQESRPILTGMNIKIDNNILECTATDSYRLARKQVEVQSNLENNINIVIPTRNLLEILKLLPDDEDNLELHIFNNKVIFKFNSIIVMCRLINGTYPDTSKLIPVDFKVKAIVNLQEYIEAIDRASLLTNESDKNTIKLELKEQQIVISSSIPEIGNVEEKITVENENSNNINIAFSSKYMMDALRSFDCKEIELLFNDEIHPIILKNTESDDLIQLILPIRTY